MENVIKEHIREMKEKIEIIEKVIDSVDTLDVKKYFINEMIKKIEEQIIQVKIYLN